MLLAQCVHREGPIVWCIDGGDGLNKVGIELRAKKSNRAQMLKVPGGGASVRMADEMYGVFGTPIRQQGSGVASTVLVVVVFFGVCSAVVDLGSGELGEDLTTPVMERGDAGG